MTSISADEALQRLMAGNERFLRGEASEPPFRPEHLADIAKGQRPFATLLGCSDSRVSPEHIFDVGLGELFVVRVAGNVFSPEVVGSIQYAVAHLKTPLVVILGHEGCGAVHAAMDVKYHGEQHLSRIQKLVDSIVPGLPPPDPSIPPDEFEARAVECNVRWTMHQILESPEAKARQADGLVKLVGAIYEIETGRVRLIAQEQGPVRDVRQSPRTAC
jgi:carbonic anhydrase